jgi:hypothetical protein
MQVGRQSKVEALMCVAFFLATNACPFPFIAVCRTFLRFRAGVFMRLLDREMPVCAHAQDHTVSSAQEGRDQGNHEHEWNRKMFQILFQEPVPA